ncbi:MAG: ParB/RepB/Spo0J family partition protein [Bacillota bacterium]|jgi:ParB family chromosome partitioning protein|nr:ParB/RepB/Spo0J family partition protein [Candidatus Fermentithermobacillaceae bacterium]
MSTVAAGKFESIEVPISAIDLREGSFLPGGEEAVSRAVLVSLIKGTGQPVLVRPLGNRYELVAGDLEYWVARARGEEVITCWVQEMDDVTALLTRIAEGARRKDINPVEEAKLISRLVHDYGMSHQEIAIRCGRRQCTISNKLRLLRLPDKILDALKSGQIGERQARALLTVPGESKQLELFRRCVRMKLTAGQMEELCKLSSGKATLRGMLPPRKHKLVFKDPRIFQNTLRRIVAEMKKAGLDVVYREEVKEKSWEFRVLCRKS